MEFSEKPSPLRHSASLLSPAQYEQILESLTSGAIVLDAEGVVITANQAACTHLEVGRRELEPGRRLDDIAVAGPFLGVVDETRAGKADLFRREVVLTLAQNRTKVIGLNTSLLRGPAEYNGVIILFTDLTQLRELERTAEVNRQLATIGELTAKVVHELRNPVAVIRGMTELLVRHSEPDTPDHGRGVAILDETQTLERLIAQFLGFSKPFVLERAHVAPRALIERAGQLCLARAKEKQVALEVSCADDLPEMWADKDKVSRALANIISNGIEAAPAAGGRVALEAYRDGPHVVFVAADNGPGIHVEDGEDIFKPFFSTKEDGTGLGLAIVHRTVTAHDGAIAYSNLPDGGARFEVRLPFAKEE